MNIYNLQTRRGLVLLDDARIFRPGNQFTGESEIPLLLLLFGFIITQITGSLIRLDCSMKSTDEM